MFAPFQHSWPCPSAVVADPHSMVRILVRYGDAVAHCRSVEDAAELMRRLVDSTMSCCGSSSQTYSESSRCGHANDGSAANETSLTSSQKRRARRRARADKASEVTVTTHSIRGTISTCSHTDDEMTSHVISSGSSGGIISDEHDERIVESRSMELPLAVKDNRDVDVTQGESAGLPQEPSDGDVQLKHIATLFNGLSHGAQMRMYEDKLSAMVGTDSFEDFEEKMKLICKKSRGAA